MNIGQYLHWILHLPSALRMQKCHEQETTIWDYEGHEFLLRPKKEDKYQWKI